MRREGWIGLGVVASVLAFAWLLFRQDDTAPDDVSKTRHEADRVDDDPSLVGRKVDAPEPVSRGLDDDPVQTAWPAARSPRVPFAGVVLAPDGSPVAEAEITVRRGAGSLRLRSAADGRFEIRIPAGRYDLSFVEAAVGGRFYLQELVDAVAWADHEVELLAAGSVWLRFVGGDEPRAGRAVQLTSEADRFMPIVREGVTDADGVVRFDDLPPLTVTARVPVRGGWTLHQPLNVGAGKRPLDRNLPTGPGGVLSGTVRDADTSLPVAGARVEAWLMAIGSGARVEASMVTAADGAFAFTPIRGTLLAFRVYADGYATWPTDDPAFQKERNAWTWDKNRERFPVHAKLAEGYDRTIEVALTRGRTIQGHVTDEAGRDLPDLALELRGHTRLGQLSFAGRTDAHGRYRITGLPDVTLILTFPAPAWYADKWHECRYSSRHENPDPYVLDVTLRAARRLTGTVADAGGAPVLGARVWLHTDERFITYRLATARRQGRVLETFTDQEGGWTLEDAPPWEEIQVYAARGDSYAKPHPLRGEGPEPRPIPLVLGTGGVIRGHVTDRAGWAKAEGEVHLRPVDAHEERSPRRARLYRTTEFEFVGVEPGRWALTAHLGDLATVAAVDVEVVAGEIHVVQVPLAREASLTGVVVDASGRAIAQARVLLRGRWPIRERRGKDVEEQALTDADGRFRFEGTRPGDYRVEVWADGFVSRTVHRLFGYEQDLRVVLEPK